MAKKRRTGMGPLNDDVSFLVKPTPQVRIGIPRITDRLTEAFIRGGEKLTSQLDKSNPATLKEYKVRLRSFVTSFDSKYPPPRIEALLKAPLNAIKKPSTLRRVWAASLLYLTLKESLYLYALQMDGPAIIDSYSVVEKFASRLVLKNLDPNGRTQRC
jgi:hypothetical protein